MSGLISSSQEQDAVPVARHPTFRSPELEQRFRTDGFAVLDLFDRAETADLRSRFEAIYQGETENACHRSNESLDLGYRRALHGLITGALQPAVDELLVDHRSFSSGTLVKWKGPESVMPAHQDWTVVDETRYRSLSFWVPLCDVDESNGAMAMLPGSHKVLTALRVNPGRPPSAPDPTDGLDPSSLTSVPMQRGQLMVFDHGTLHYSPPSTSDEPRAALVLASTPAEAVLQHFWRRPEDDVIEQYEVADPDFFRLCTPGIAPESPEIRLVDSFPFEPHPPMARAWMAERVRYFD